MFVTFKLQFLFYLVQFHIIVWQTAAIYFIDMKDLIPERQKLFYNEVELSLDHHSLDHYNIRSLGGVIYLDDKGF